MSATLLPDTWDPSSELSRSQLNEQLLLFQQRLARLEATQALILANKGALCPADEEHSPGPVNTDQWVSDAQQGGAGVIATRTGTVSHLNNTSHLIAFDDEDKDTEGWHDTSTNNHRITVDKTGWYLAHLVGFWAYHATGSRVLTISPIGTNAEGGTTLSQPAFSVGSLPHRMQISSIVYLEADDYIECRALQNSGVSLNFGSSSTFLNHLSVVPYGPPSPTARYLSTSWGRVPALVTLSETGFPLKASTLEYGGATFGRDYYLKLLSEAATTGTDGTVSVKWAHRIPKGFKRWGLAAIKVIYELHFTGLTSEYIMDVTLKITDSNSGLNVTKTIQWVASGAGSLSEAYGQEILLSRGELESVSGFGEGDGYILEFEVQTTGTHAVDSSVCIGPLQINYDCT